ncbi:MAG: hypothetical protein WC760_06335 [Bacteroidia bacterium]|jgi:NTP pyrophosphatase (non-canonical NTP hydrolase)
MNAIEQNEVLTEAINKYGIDSQMNMVVEECAELIKAINKFRRVASSENLTELCGEVSDVEIMCAQVRIMLNKQGLIDKIKEEKIERLKYRLQKY